MTQEEKELLLKDLCARLPYGVKVHIKGEYRKSHKVEEIDVADNLIRYFENMHLCEERIDNCRLYLRPMSSMTEEEKHKLLKFGVVTCLENGEVIDVSCVGFERHADVQDYLNTCHFDYRGLIEKGLALEAPNGMYK